MRYTDADGMSADDGRPVRVRPATVPARPQGTPLVTVEHRLAVGTADLAPVKGYRSRKGRTWPGYAPVAPRTTVHPHGVATDQAATVHRVRHDRVQSHPALTRTPATWQEAADTALFPVYTVATARAAHRVIRAAGLREGKTTRLLASVDARILTREGRRAV